jgi:hypothetical protein
MWGGKFSRSASLGLRLGVLLLLLALEVLLLLPSRPFLAVARIKHTVRVSDDEALSEVTDTASHVVAKAPTLMLRTTAMKVGPWLLLTISPLSRMMRKRRRLPRLLLPGALYSISAPLLSGRVASG